MAVQNLEDLCVNKLFLITYELLNLRLEEQFRLYMQDTTFAERPSQKLLTKILIHDCKVLYNFAPFLSSLSNIALKSVKFDNFEFLNQFNLSSFSCKSMKSLDIEKFLQNFNDETRLKMRYLRLRKIGINNDKLFFLPLFANIKFLDLSQTNLSTPSLAQVCESMSFLVGLNISGTKVDDLFPLNLLKRQMEFLDLHDLCAEALNGIFVLIKEMEKLRHLDLSVSRSAKSDLGNECDILCCKSLSSLRLLDLSGHQDNLSNQLVITILRRAHRLKYFIYNTESAFYAVTDNHKLKQFFKNLSKVTIVGAFSKQTMLNSLSYSLEHRRYLTTSLHQLFDRTKNAPFVSEALNETLLASLRLMSARKHDWLVAATAVLYNLTRGHLAEAWTIAQLSESVSLLLGFLEAAGESQQLTVNVLLVLCNDFVLQTAVVDRLRLGRLVFRSLARFESADNIGQAAVIIVSVLASELTKSELCSLVEDPAHFQALLVLVCRRCVLQEDLESVPGDSYLAVVRPQLREAGPPLCDFTLKFALSSLWNLTDECAPACQQFLEQRGLTVYRAMVARFRAAAPEVATHVYNKCLGLLNNIAEEKSCRSALLTKDYMSFLLEMLDQEDIQMTYFAGGILSNLLLIPDDEWKGTCDHDKAFYENRIYVAVDAWVSPTNLMASYRSFVPFENLIANAGSSRAILLWALWAIRHTMKIERARYASILERHEQLVEYIGLLAGSQSPSYGRIRGLASDVLLLLRQVQDGTDGADLIVQMMVE